MKSSSALFCMCVLVNLAFQYPAEGAAIAGNPALTCSSSAPSLPIDEATLAGQERYKKYRDSVVRGKGANLLRVFLNAAFSEGVRMQVDAALTKVANDAAHQLEWTGDQVAAIEVMFQRELLNDLPPELLRVTLIGSGNCVYDVVVDTLGDSLEGPKPGYVVDNDTSFYTSVRRDVKSGKVEVVPVTPGSRGLIYAKAVGDKAAKEMLRQTEAAREYSRLQGLVTAIEQRDKDQAVRKQMNEALEAAKDAATHLQQIEKRLADDLAQQARIKGSRTWIDTLGAALTFAQLITHVQAMLGPSTPTAVLSSIGDATDLEKAKSLLSDYDKVVTSSVTTGQDDLVVTRKKLEASKTTITNKAIDNGAPKSAVKVP